MNITRGKIVKYALLPGIIPRMQLLLGSGFFYIAYLIALVFQSVRLLPPGHAYLQPQNMGRFGLRNVLAQAARNLTFKKKNIDQILIYTAILSGVVILFLQFALIIIAALMTQPVLATSVNFATWFQLSGTPTTGDQDIAMILLDSIFGVTGIFNSCISTAAPCLDHNANAITEPTSYPYPIHKALHQLFRFYSIGISLIALMIILYYITTIIGETATTGTPFGQRFNRAWAPVRLIAFFALIAPLNIGGTNEGLNGAQLITLNVAKFGSHFATNAWIHFNDTHLNTVGGSIYGSVQNTEELVAIPPPPELGNMAQFWSIAHACMYAEKKRGHDIRMYLVRHPPISIGPHPPNYVDITDPYTPQPSAFYPSGFLSFSEPLAFMSNGNKIYIRLGLRDTDTYANEIGAVKPICGEVTFTATSFLDSSGTSNVNDGAMQAQSGMWYSILSYMITTGSTYGADIKELSECFIDKSPDPRSPLPCSVSPETVIPAHMTTVKSYLSNVRNQAVYMQAVHGARWNIRDELMQKGWGGAAILYNRIARMNGELSTAMINVPKVKSWPIIMEQVRQFHLTSDENNSGSELFSPNLPEGASLDRPEDLSYAAAYYGLYKTWENFGAVAGEEREPLGNPVIDSINALFGTAGLFDLRRPGFGSGGGVPAGFTHPGNAAVHPLALLSSLGKGMVEKSIVHFGVATTGTIANGLLGIFSNFPGASVTIDTATSMASTIFKIIILVGAMLYYVLPFLPFIYFFFAMSGWIKSIFEAMVAMPLWALAHLRIDGEGLPGPGATNGYYLLLEIFVRPILILIGLIASIALLGATVGGLNMVFDIMIENVGGSDRDAPIAGSISFYRGPIDEMFYTIIYAAIVYMLATSSFKLIDSVPNNILRYMGISVSTIQENIGDPAGQLSSGIYQKGNLAINQMKGGLGSRGRAAILMQQ